MKWELELRLKDTKQYLKLMKKILKADKHRSWGATELQVTNDWEDPSMRGIILTIYCQSGSVLKQYAKMMEEVENEGITSSN